MAEAISKVPGIEPASVNNGVVPAGDALDIHVDPAAAAMEGLTPAEVASQLNQYLHGSVVTQLSRHGAERWGAAVARSAAAEDLSG